MHRWMPGSRYRLLRPRETKTYGPRADVQTPVLQYLVAVIVICLSGLLILSWIMFMPPLIPWLVGMALFALSPPAIWFYMTGWILVNIVGVTRTDTNQVIGHILTWLMVQAVFIVLAYYVFWDWWEHVTYSGFFGIPTPHLDMGSPLLWIGLVLFALGGVFILWKPSGYTFSIQAIGAVLGIASWYFRSPSLYWTKGATATLSKGDLVFYGVWLALSISVWVPAWFLLDRMFTEMRDDFPFEGAEPPLPETVTQTKYRFISRSEGRPRPSLTPPAIISTFDGTNDTIVRVDEFIEFLYLVQRRGTFSRDKLFPYRFECSRRQVTQWNHWVELIHPLEPDVYDRATREIQPEYQKEDGTLDVENVIAMMTLGSHQNGAASVSQD